MQPGYTPVAMDTKTCTKCGTAKPLTTEHYNQLPSGGWRGTCKNCMAANMRRHYQNDPEKVKARVRKYATQKTAAGGSHDAWDIANIRRRLGDKCAYCRIPLNGAGEIDHKTPISQGGDNSPENLTLACRTCNRDKHGKTAAEFRAWRQHMENVGKT